MDFYLLLVFIFCIILLVVCFYIYFNSYEDKEESDDGEEDINPTMYSFCDIGINCGNDLVCDKQRCKKDLGGECSTLNDCRSGLICHNWMCTNSNNQGIKLVNKIEKRATNKNVRWNDNNQIYYI